MSKWFDVPSVGDWERIENHPHRLTYKHAETGDRLVVLRIQGPADPDGYADYVLRHVASDGTSWTDISITDDMAAIETDVREAMQRCPG